MNQQISDYLQHLAGSGMSVNTIGAYRVDLEQLRTFLASRTLADWASVTQDDITAFLAFLQSRGYSDATAARRIAAVRAFFTHLAETQVIPTNPTAAIASVKVEASPPHVLTPTQVDELLELPLRNPSPERLRDKAMFEVLYATGMRVSELIALDRAHLSLEQAEIRCTGKGGRERTLPLGEAAVTALEEYLDIARPQLARGAAQKTEALFLNHRGKRLSRQGVWLILHGYGRELGIDDLTPQTLRHSFAAHTIGNGADVRSVQALLGHASHSTTQVYTKLEPVGTAAH